MRPLAVWAVLLGLSLAAWSERAPRVRDAFDAAAAVGSPQAREDAHFRRVTELALATGQVPRFDRFLDGGREVEVGRAPPWPALAAAGARRSVLRGLDGEALSRLEPQHLARLFERWAALLGTLAVSLVFLVARRWHDGAARDPAALLAAGIAALGSGTVLAEQAGRVEPAALETLLGCALLAAAHLSLRGRDEWDGVAGALLCGPLCGLALVAAPGLVPLCAAWFSSSVLRSGPHGESARRRGRAPLLAAAGALLTVHLTLGSPVDLAWNWPAAAPRLPASAREFTLGWPAWVLLPAATAILAGLAAPGTRMFLVGWGATALAWGALFGAAAPGVRLAGCVLFALALARVSERVGARRRPLVWATAVLLAAPGLLGRREAGTEHADTELARRASWASALEHLRLWTPSTGPWNHPGAPPDGFVLCAPEVGVEVAAGARRAVFASELPRLRTPPGRRAQVERARALLDTPPGEAIAAELSALGVRYVLLGPGDPPRAPGGLAALLADGAHPPAGLEPLWPEATGGREGATCLLWRVVGDARRP